MTGSASQLEGSVSASIIHLRICWVALFAFQLTSLELQYVSPKLLMCRDLELAVPGTYEPHKPVIHIRHVHSSLNVITSKQRPRKLCITGNLEDFNKILFTDFLGADAKSCELNLTIVVFYQSHRPSTISYIIGYFRVPKTLTFKTRLSAKFSLCRWCVLMLWNNGTLRKFPINCRKR